MQEEFSEFANFPQNLKAAILAKGYTQNKLAEITNLSHITISRYITTARMPRAEELYKIAKVLDVSMECLLTGRKDEESEWQKRALAAEAKLVQILDVLPLLGEVNAKLTKIASGKE